MSVTPAVSHGSETVALSHRQTAELEVAELMILGFLIQSDSDVQCEKPPDSQQRLRLSRGEVKVNK